MREEFRVVIKQYDGLNEYTPITIPAMSSAGTDVLSLAFNIEDFEPS